MLGVMPTVDEFVSNAKSRLSAEQLKDSSIVSSCELNAKLMFYQTFLSHTDYVPLKIIEGVATAADYADTLKQREDARQQINTLLPTTETIKSNP